MKKINEIIRLGEDIDNDILSAVSEIDKEFQYAVYHYEAEPYEGSGELIVKTRDGRFFCESLSHCSCYGPTERWGTQKFYDTFDQLSTDSSEGWRNEFNSVMYKVNEIEKEPHAEDQDLKKI